MKFPVTLHIKIRGKRIGRITIKNRNDYRTLRDSGFSRPDGQLNSTFYPSSKS